MSTSALDELWQNLVTAALLGTDRRDPPTLPPGLLADVVADAVRPDPATRLLAAVAAVAAARRAAFAALPGPAGLQPPTPDPRPVITAASADAWRRVIAEWPVLEDEWMLRVLERGWRLPPDVTVDALVRHRADAVRRSRVALAAGPVAGWLTDHLPELEPRGRGSAPAEAVTTLPELPVPPDLAGLLGADAHTFIARLAERLDGFRPSDRPVLVNLVARCRPAVLADAASLFGAHPSGLGAALGDLARLRSRMLDELQRPGGAVR